MKKLSLLFGFLAFVFMLASNTYSQTYTMTGSGDTVTNTETEACSLKVVNSYKAVTVHTVITKLSGTVAGTVTLQGTIDGTTWVTVDTAALITEGASTYTATDVTTNTKTWIIDGAPYLWFKLSYTGSGTMAAIFNGYLLPRQRE
jgi:hypothetical protein